MTLPKFLDKFLSKKKEEIDYFLALEIKKGVTKVAIWNNVEGASVLIGTAEKEISENWEEIIVKVDEAITEAAGTIDQDKINKTIFGLPPSWIEEGKIRKDILLHLKKLCSDLTLTPLGFVMNTESILSYLQKTEAAPLTAILVGVTSKEITLTISRVGKIYTNKTWNRKSVSISNEIAEVLKEGINQEILPSRIILYDGKEDLEIVKQELISFPWTQKASFLHFPKVEILSKEADIEGLIHLGAREMGSEFPIEKENVSEETPLVVNDASPRLEPVKSPDLLGFIEDKDIAEDMKIVEEKRVINEPVIIHHEEKKETALPAEIPKPAIKLPSLQLPRLAPDFSALGNILPGKFPLIALLIIILILGGGTVWGYWQFAKAEVKIYIQPDVLEKEADIIVNPNSKKVDINKNEIPALPLEIEETGTLKKATTGEKTVGDKAKGEVTVYNKTTSGSKTFKSGTILIGADNKQFTTDSDITIPAAQDQTEGLTYGKTKVNVTAMDIGSEFNLPAGKKDFQVKEYPASSYAGVSDTAFTGGSSKKIKIVTEADKTQLMTNLLNNLQAKTKTDLEQKISKEQKLIAESIEKVSDKPKYSANIDNEAVDLTLTDTVKFKAFAYDEVNIKEIVENIIKKTVSGNFELKDAKTDMQVKDKKDLEGSGNNKGAVELKVVFKTKLIPKINKGEIQQAIRGKNEDTVKNYIGSLPNVVGFEANVSPKLPPPFFLFPRNSQNIFIEIVTKE